MLIIGLYTLDGNELNAGLKATPLCEDAIQKARAKANYLLMPVVLLTEDNKKTVFYPEATVIAELDVFNVKPLAKLTAVERTLISSLTELARAKLRGVNLAFALDVIVAARMNTDDNVLTRKACERGEWASLFIASIGTLLADSTRAHDTASAANLSRVRAVFNEVLH